ncbi:MAG: PAS domain S-box protein [Sandaracinaceae bacterium]|nr:PAS domain S-box protein [Sandaracinaceae bacterium]
MTRVDAQGVGIDPQVAAWLLAAQDAIVVVDREARIVLANPAAAALLEREDLVGSPLSSTIPPELRDAHERLVQGFHQSPRMRPMGHHRGIVVVTGTGARLPLEIALVPISVHGETGAVATLRDVSEQRRKASALSESAARLEALVASAPDVVLYWDRNGRIELINRTVPGVRPEDVLGDGWRSLLPPEGQAVLDEAMARALGTSDLVTLELPSFKPAGSTWEARMNRVVRDGEVTGLVMLARDVTSRKREESQLAASEQLASLGMISAALAHEINNPLAAAMWNVEYAIEALVSGDRVAPLAALEEARDALVALRDISRDLRLFGREERLAVQVVDVNAVLESTLRLARNELRHHARVVVDLQPVPRVRASEARLGQVFLNLLVNAAQAIPQGESERNEITVRTAVDPEGRVRIDIADSGAGMSDSVRMRLFTPFFTTKPIGVGTGLGLSICQRIVTSAGGTIEVQSAPGAGSLFTVLLPPATSEDRESISSGDAILSPVSRRVLLVDDDQVVVRALVRALRGHHDVVGVTSARDALEEIERQVPEVIVCDVMMPDTTGGELVERVVARWPSLATRVVFLTGGAFGEGGRDLASRQGTRILHKPVSLGELLETIAKVCAR